VICWPTWANDDVGDHVFSFDYRFPAELISHAVWLYHVFSLSFRDVELLLAERGVIVSYESVRQWCCEFGATLPASSAVGDPDRVTSGTLMKSSFVPSACCIPLASR